MNAVVPFFLLAPLFLVPFGFRLLGMATPGAEPPALIHRAVLPAGLLLTLSFIAAPGLPAAALSLPWLAVTVIVALAAGVRLLRDPARFRPGVRHATDAAVAFLAVGAVFATTDRLGARPLDFAPDVILLTAVHFHFAGFALPLAGALAHGRRPSRWLEVALGAVVFGIPITALGFIGVPYANWVGAMLTATGGIGIGLTTVLVALGLRQRRSRILALVAGASLLVSMPMAVIYSTGVLIGATWLDLTTMARIHGGLNSLGFALAAILAWTFERIALEGGNRRARAVAGASPRRRWAIGLLVGLVVGVGVLIGGPMVGLIGIAAVVLLAYEPGRDTPAGGLLTGFGAAWLALFVRADASCGERCTGPDLTAWYAFAGIMLVVGIALTIRTFLIRSSGSRSGTGPARPADVIWFNWPPFVVGSICAGLALIAALLPLPPLIRVALATGAIVTFAYIASASAAVLWVFGVGAAKRWRWVRDRATTPNRWLNVTTGFDDSTATLRTLLPVGHGESIDVFDTSDRAEAPLRRGRTRFPPSRTSRPVSELTDALPDAVFDVVFLLMAAHEAHGGDRARLFNAVARALTPDGRVILVEHLRNIPNVIAFGPGAWHFQARATWLEAAEAAGLRSVSEVRLSPFVRGFVFVRASATTRQGS